MKSSKMPPETAKFSRGGENQAQPAGEGGKTRASQASSRGMPPAHRASPFGFMRRFSEEMDRLFEDFTGTDFPSLFGGFGRGTSWPQIEMHQRDNQLVVCADLPGVSKDDVQIEIADGVLSITGERRHATESTEKGIHRSERSYGSFCRRIAVPEGADVEHANASFHDGVLEITIPTPPAAMKHGRRIEIRANGLSAKTGNVQNPQSRREEHAENRR